MSDNKVKLYTNKLGTPQYLENSLKKITSKSLDDFYESQREKNRKKNNILPSNSSKNQTSNKSKSTSNRFQPYSVWQMSEGLNALAEGRPILPFNSEVSYASYALDTMYNKGSYSAKRNSNVTSKALASAGWENNYDFETNIHPVMYNLNGKVILMTPIQSDGKILSPTELQNEAVSIARGNKDTKGIYVGTFDNEDKAADYFNRLYKNKLRVDYNNPDIGKNPYVERTQYSSLSLSDFYKTYGENVDVEEGPYAWKIGNDNYYRINNEKTIKIPDDIKNDIMMLSNRYSDGKEFNDAVNKYMESRYGENLNKYPRDTEISNVESYIGLKKFEKIKNEGNVENPGVRSYIWLPIAKFLEGGEKAGLNLRKFFTYGIDSEGNYAKDYAEEKEMYENDISALGENYFAEHQPDKGYLYDLQNAKFYNKPFENVNPTYRTISEYTFGMAGELFGDAAIASCLGLPQIVDKAGDAVKYTSTLVSMSSKSTKIAKGLYKANEIVNKTPHIKINTGSKIIKSTVNKVNGISVGKIAKFLNPLDNPTTALMGMGAMKNKQEELIAMGYDSDTAFKNALFTGYISAITEKMGYSGLDSFKNIKRVAVPNILKSIGRIGMSVAGNSFSEGLEEVYNIVLERTVDVLTGVGYQDENGNIKQRTLLGNEGILDMKAIAQSFLGGMIGGYFLGGANAVYLLSSIDYKAIKNMANDYNNVFNVLEKDITNLFKEANIEKINFPERIDFNDATPEEMNEYYSKYISAIKNSLNNPDVITHDMIVPVKANLLIQKANMQTYRNSPGVSTAERELYSRIKYLEDVMKSGNYEKLIKNVESINDFEITHINKYTAAPVNVTKDGDHFIVKNIEGSVYRYSEIDFKNVFESTKKANKKVDNVEAVAEILGKMFNVPAVRVLANRMGGINNVVFAVSNCIQGDKKTGDALLDNVVNMVKSNRNIDNNSNDFIDYSDGKSESIFKRMVLSQGFAKGSVLLYDGRVLTNARDKSNTLSARISPQILRNLNYAKKLTGCNIIVAKGDLSSVNPSLGLSETDAGNSNGYFDAPSNSIVLNFDKIGDAEYIFNSVLTHEMTHSAESSQHYKALSDYVLKDIFGDITTTEGKLALDNAIKKKVSEYYKKSNGKTKLSFEGAKKEIVAQRMAEMLNDPETGYSALTELASRDLKTARGIVNTIKDTYNRIKDKLTHNEGRYYGKYVKLAKYEEAIKLFEKAVRDGAKNRGVATGEKVSYMIKESELHGKVAFVDGKNIPRQKGESIPHAIRTYFNKKFRGQEITVDSTQDNVIMDRIGKYLYPGDEKTEYIPEKNRVASIIDEIIKISDNKTWNKNLLDKDGNVKNHGGLDCSGGFNYYDTKFAVDNSGVIYGGTVIVRIDKQGRLYFYDLDNIREAGYQDENEFYPVKEISPSFSFANENISSAKEKTSLNENIPQNTPVVNGNNSGNSTNNTQNDFTDYSKYRNGDNGNTAVLDKPADNKNGAVDNNTAETATKKGNNGVEVIGFDRADGNYARFVDVIKENAPRLNDVKPVFDEDNIDMDDSHIASAPALGDVEILLNISDPEILSAVKRVISKGNICKAEKVSNGNIYTVIGKGKLKGQNSVLGVVIEENSSGKMSVKGVVKTGFGSGGFVGEVVKNGSSTENAGSEKSPAKFTEDDLLEAYDRKETLQKDYEKAKRKIRLTDEEKYQLDGLLSGKVRKENIPPEFNIEGIMELYKYKSAIESENSKIQQHNAIRKEKLKARAKSLLETSDTWKEKKSGFAYGRETMERNIRDMVKDKATADAIIDEYFTPVHHNEAERTRFKNKMRGLVKKLNISEKVVRGDKVSENFAVQFLGELNGDISYLESKKRLTEKDRSRLGELKAQREQFLEDNPSFQNKEKMKKVERAIRNARRIYDYLFDEMNRVRVRNGYSPVEYRHNYFPHFITEEADGILGQMAKAIGINMDVTELPTNIAGKTQNFKPGIRYFKNAQRRWGIKTDFEFLQGFDKYIEGVSDVIYHTDDIQRLRSLETALSEKYSEKGVEDEIKALEEDTTLDSKEKYRRIKDLVEKDLTKFGGFAMELREYTNLLANKKSRFDRNAETFWRRHAYNVFNAINRNVAVNMIAGNISSAFTNFIPLAQAKAECSTRSLIKAANETVSSYAHDDHLVNMSDFLTNRFGSEKLTKTKTEKFNDALMTPMSLVDNFTSQVIWRAKYHDSIKKGMGASQAIKTADSFAAGLLADRSKGAMPTIFSARNIIAKSLTMFQVEVNNQYSYLFKDLPNAKEKKRELAAAFMWYFFASYLFNDLYEKVMGRRPAFDPLGMANDFAGNTFGKKIPNTVDVLNSIMSGEKIDFDTNKKKVKGGALIGLVDDVAENLPFVGGLLGGGRVPISSGIPFADDPQSIIDAFAPGTAKERRNQILSDELPKLAYSVLPYGGAGQAIKTIKGISTVNKGGKYTYNSKGEKQLQYPVHNDTVEESNRNYVQAALFGRNALPAAQDWVKNEFDTMSVKDTERYDLLKGNGVKSKLSYDTVREISALPEAKYKNQYDYIESSILPKKSKTDLKITYMSKDARENLEEAKKAGISDDFFVDTHYKFEYQGEKQHSLLPEKEQKAFVKEKDKKSSSVLKRAYLVTNEDLTPEQRLAMDRILINDETKKTVEDYSDLGHFYYSELSDAQKKRLPYAQQVIDVDVRSYYYWWKKTSGLKGKKNQKISKLQEMGMDYRTALLWYEYVLK